MDLLSKSKNLREKVLKQELQIFKKSTNKIYHWGTWLSSYPTMLDYAPVISDCEWFLKDFNQAV